MAKQKGVFPMVGTIGGVNFYYLNGKPVARAAGGGFNGKAIKTKKSMQRVRENGSEFGHCSKVNKAFRLALRPFYNTKRFTFFHSRLMGLFTGLKDLDTVNIRGKRCVANGVGTEEGKRLLVDFAYTPDCTPKMVLPFSFAMDWGTYSLHITQMAMRSVRFITGATHIELRFGILDFDFESLAYKLHMSDSVFLTPSYAGSDVTMVPNSLPTVLGTDMAVLGVRFHQEIDGKRYLLNADDGVGIWVVGFGV
jgi:hypothetical protein